MILWYKPWTLIWNIPWPVYHVTMTSFLWDSSFYRRWVGWKRLGNYRVLCCAHVHVWLMNLWPQYSLACCCHSEFFTRGPNLRSSTCLQSNLHLLNLWGKSKSSGYCNRYTNWYAYKCGIKGRRGRGKWRCSVNEVWQKCDIPHHTAYGYSILLSCMEIVQILFNLLFQVYSW